jgi:hypothetical protein
MSHEIIYENYINEVKKVIDEEPVILVDDSDNIKPYETSFEALGMVRDGSSKDKKLEKGYCVTEMVSLTKKERHPMSIYSHIHSSLEKNYKSTNEETFKGIDQVIKHFKTKCTCRLSV